MWYLSFKGTINNNINWTIRVYPITGISTFDIAMQSIRVQKFCFEFHNKFQTKISDEMTSNFISDVIKLTAVTMRKHNTHSRVSTHEI